MVGGSTNEAETGRGWEFGPVMLIRLRRTIPPIPNNGPLLTHGKLLRSSFEEEEAAGTSVVDRCLSRRFKDLEAPVPSFLMATRCRSSDDTGLCLIPIGVRNVVFSFFGGSIARQVSKATLPRSKCSKWCLVRSPKGEDSNFASSSATVYMCRVSRTLLVDTPGTGDFDLFF